MSEDMFWAVEKPILSAMGIVKNRICEEGCPNSLQIVLHELLGALEGLAEIRRKCPVCAKNHGTLTQDTEKSKSRRRSHF